MAKKKVQLIDGLTIAAELRLALGEELSGADKWDISKALTQCEQHEKDYDALRLELCKKYGKLDEKTNVYTFEVKERQQFNDELKALQEKEITINHDIDFKKTFDKIKSKNPYHKVNLLR